MGHRAKYGKLLHEIANAADKIALKYFRALELQVERKKDGTAVTQADHEVEEMARARVAASGLELDVLGEEMGGGPAAAAGTRPRLIIDPIDGTEEFLAGYQRLERCWVLRMTAKLSRRWRALRGCIRGGKGIGERARIAERRSCVFRT